MEIRCAVGPGSALPARTSDPAEDLRPRPRRHIVPANEMLVRLLRYVYGGDDLAPRIAIAKPFDDTFGYTEK